MTLPVESPAVYTDLKGLAALKRDAKAQDPQALREAARQFESIFTRMMLKSMREANATFGDKLTGSDQQDFYQGMFDDQLAVQLSHGKGLGLADMLVQQLTRAGLAANSPDAKGTQPAGAATVGPNSPIASTATASKVNAAAADAMLRSLSGMDPGLLENSNIEQEVDDIAAKVNLPDLTASVDAAARAASGSGSAGTAVTWPPASREDFVRQLLPLAQKAGQALGIDPRHILAQAALETGWGHSVPTDAQGNPSFNFFGIKSGSQWNGASVSVRTLEFEHGLPVAKRDSFRAYDSPKAAFNDYVSVLQSNPRYAAALNTGQDAHAFALGLQRGGYATDPAYARKIAAIAQNLAAGSVDLKSAQSQPITPTTDTL